MERNLIYPKGYLSKSKHKLKLFFYFIFFILLNTHIHSQTIQVLDKKNNKPISSVLIEIESVKTPSLEKNYGFSNKSGIVKYKLLPPFKITASHIGYKDYNNKFKIEDLNQIEGSLIIFLEPSYQPLEEVVVTGQIGEQNKTESMNTFITISRDKIQSMSSNNLGELLSNESLFDLNIDPVLGTSLSIQGIQGNNVNILIDGVPIIGRKSGQINLDQIDLSNIDKIEILKGPASVNYGTNSTGGIINLITKKKEDQVKINFYKESIGIEKCNINVNKNNNTSYLNLNFGGYQFAGIDNDQSTRKKDWNYKKQNFGDISWSTYFKKNELKLKSSFFAENIIDLGEESFLPPPGIGLSGQANDNQYSTYRNTNYLKINRSDDSYVPNGLIAYSITKFNKKQYVTDLTSNQSIQTNNSNYNGEDIFKSIYSRWEYNKLDIKQHQIQFGLDFNYENVNGDKIQNGNAKIYEYSIFSQFNFKITKRINTLLGLRIPYHSIYNAPVTPSINIKYDINNETYFRASYARGFRAPTIKELFMEFIDINHNIIGNDELNSEKSHSFQSSLDLSPLKMENKFISISIEGFINYLNNKITLAQIEESSAYTYFNIENETYYGINTNINTIIKSSNFTFNWNIYNVENELFTYTKPRQNISASYGFKYEKWNLKTNITWKYKSTSEYQRISENGEFTSYQQEPYQLINFKLHKEFPKINTSFSFGIKNLLNIKTINSAIQEGVHSNTESIVSWGRTCFIELRFNLIN